MKKEPKTKWRINLISVFIFLLAVGILTRLVYLQIVNHEFYKALAQGQQKIFKSTQGERGDIFFNNGQILATNIKGKYVFISPIEIQKSGRTEEIINNLVQELGVEKEWLAEKTKKESFFELIKHKISQEEEDSLKKADLPGVYVNSEVLRNYPQRNLASHIIGFLGGEGAGQYGIEGYYDETLRGKEYFQELEKSPLRYLQGLSPSQAEGGSSIFLTVDYNIQFMAEKLLKKAKEDSDIESGQIIVMEPATGKIIALANFPDFDPNNYSKVNKIEIFQNSAIQKIFEPGSAFKPITMAGALNEEKITPQTTYEDIGSVTIKDRTVYNFDRKKWGRRTMTEVLERSINTGAIFAEQQLGHALFLDYIEKFGFFEPTEIDLQGEIFSQNPGLKKGYEINYATASFGQGIEMTPLQLARAFSAIANAGKLVKPYIVEKIMKDDRVVTQNQPKIIRSDVISPQTASHLTAMLVSVVENGSGKKARVRGYYIAGKTGTAQVSFPALGINKPGYSEKTTQSFIGFGPAFNPRFVILVKLDNPKAGGAEYSAAPIFAELAKYILDYWQIPPDKE